MANYQAHPSNGTVSFVRTITEGDETRLAVPAAFISKCFKHIPRKLYLWAEDMLQNEVHVERKQGSYYLGKGWEDFRFLYAIQLEEKLTFHWIGRENLFVTVYGQDEVRRVPERLTYGEESEGESSGLFSRRAFREKLLMVQSPSPLTSETSDENDYKCIEAGKGKRKATCLDDDDSCRSDASYSSYVLPKDSKRQ